MWFVNRKTFRETNLCWRGGWGASPDGGGGLTTRSRRGGQPQLVVVHFQHSISKGKHVDSLNCKTIFINFNLMTPWNIDAEEISLKEEIKTATLCITLERTESSFEFANKTHKKMPIWFDTINSKCLTWFLILSLSCSVSDLTSSRLDWASV